MYDMYGSLMLGPDIDEYDRVYSVKFLNDISQVRIRGLNEDMPPPKFLSAEFSADGSVVTLTSSVPTDFAKLNTFFDCSVLLKFRNSQFSKCQWSGSQNIIITPMGKNRLQYLDPIYLATTAPPIRTICGKTTGCSAMSNFTLFVKVPENVMIPEVSILSPSLIGEVSDLEIDFSISSGHGGRPWSSSEVMIKCFNESLSSTLSKDLTSQLNAGLTILTLPFSKFIKPAEYHIYLTLTNFLGKTGVGTKTVLLSLITFL